MSNIENIGRIKQSDNKRVLEDIKQHKISSRTLQIFIEADTSGEENRLKWLELNMIPLERHMRKGGSMQIDSPIGDKTLSGSSEFYQWCRLTLKNSYLLYLYDRDR